MIGLLAFAGVFDVEFLPDGVVQQGRRFRAKIEDAVREKTGGRLKEIEDRIGGIEGLGGKLSSKKKGLDSLLGKTSGAEREKAEKAKDKIENKLKDKFKKLF